VRLIKLEVSNVRRYRGGPFTVQFDARGTLLTGPNECGKSTLFEAIQHVLFDRAKTSSSWVQRLVPYGAKAMLPAVTLDFEHGGRMLRIHKRFGSRGEAALSERKGDDFCVLATQEEAEEILLQELGAQPAGGRAGSQPDKWGALQWLFVPQESCARCLSRDTMPQAGSVSIGRALRPRSRPCGALRAPDTLRVSIEEAGSVHARVRRAPDSASHGAEESRRRTQ
jgi:energy-coupling factor transporter ATP-binding protein EcfA2